MDSLRDRPAPVPRRLEVGVVARNRGSVPDVLRGERRQGNPRRAVSRQPEDAFQCLARPRWVWCDATRLEAAPTIQRSLWATPMSPGDGKGRVVGSPKTKRISMPARSSQSPAPMRAGGVRQDGPLTASCLSGRRSIVGFVAGHRGRGFEGGRVRAGGRWMFVAPWRGRREKRKH